MRQNRLLYLALVVAVGALIYGIFAGALWDPYEVTVAELARRIGLNLLGGAKLALGEADNTLPIRADLGRGELPFTSAALGFRLFGLSAWAGRLPLAVWSVLGISALFAGLSQLWDRRAAIYGALVLATLPLYFLQARALLGDAVTLATFTIAWSGLAAACFAEISGRARAAFLALGALGLYAGFWCRGPIFNVAVPALSVGVAALLQPARDSAGRWTAFAVTATGALALTLGVLGLSLAERTGEYSVFVGSALQAAVELATFDVAFGELLHSAYPWSAAAPLSWVLVARGGERSAERGAINAAALGLGSSLAASAWLAPQLGSVVLPGIACFAVLVAGGLRQLESGRLDSRLLGFGIAVMAVLIGFDLREHPNKGLSGFALPAVSLPESLSSSAASLWLGGGCVLALVCLTCLYERERAPDQAPSLFDAAEYARALRALQTTWSGNLLFALLLLEASLVGFLLLAAVSERVVSLPQWDGFGSFSRKAVALAAIVVPLAPLAVVAAMGARDLARALFSGRPAAATRAQGVLLAFAALGTIASLSFYPAFARQVSPTQAFERYRELSRRSEPLAVLGERAGAARYQGAPDARSFEEAELAFEWLIKGPAAERRWLVLRQTELPELNAQFRALHRRNVPILDAGSSELLLASNLLRAGEKSASPLSGVLLDHPPRLQHPLRAVLGEELEVLGWSLRADDGSPATSLAPARRFHLAFYLRVLAPLQGEWQSFVHIDGLQRRFNADHQLLGGKYPLRLWRPGDVVVDSTAIELEPNFSPANYRLYFGLFSGDRRLPVTLGPAQDHRIVAGTLQVR